MTVFAQIEHYQKVWRLALPHVAEPSSADAVRWCGYPLEFVEQAILRAGQRFSPDRIGSEFDARQAYRYVTAVAKTMNMQAA